MDDLHVTSLVVQCHSCKNPTTVVLTKGFLLELVEKCSPYLSGSSGVTYQKTQNCLGEWIDVTEELPTINQEVIASDGIHVEFGYISFAENPWIDFSFIPTHWMPKPDLPASKGSKGAKKEKL